MVAAEAERKCEEGNNNRVITVPKKRPAEGSKGQRPHDLKAGRFQHALDRGPACLSRGETVLAPNYSHQRQARESINTSTNHEIVQPFTGSCRVDTTPKEENPPYGIKKSNR